MIGTAKRLAAVGALCAATSLAAQSAPAPAPATTTPDSGIVVTGKQEPAPKGNQVFDEARGISRLGPHETYVVALPRFRRPVCPGVLGLRPAYADAMIGRMRADIKRLKVALADEGCSPNLVVAFAPDGHALLSALAQDWPKMFQLITPSEQAELITDEAPVRVWNNLVARWTGAGPPPENGVKPSVWGQLNRNDMPVSYDILSALVVFDQSSVKGMTLTQLADYATMRGLSHTRPPSGEQPMATILSLFDGDKSNPDKLTRFDVGYLRSLYWWNANTSAANKLADVERWAAKAADEDKQVRAK